MDAKSGNWVVHLNNDETNRREFVSAEELATFIASFRTATSGQIVGFLDCGPTRWWERLLGMGPRSESPRFAIEWSGEFAALIFLDEAGSEYRVLDHEQPVDPPETVRLQLAHGELHPHPSEECMKAPRAWQALNEFLRISARPEWLKYRYVR